MLQAGQAQDIVTLGREPAPTSAPLSFPARLAHEVRALFEEARLRRRGAGGGWRVLARFCWP